MQKIVTAIESRFGKSQRVWVMDRGMMSEENLKFLSQPGRHYLIGTRRSELANFHDALCSDGWLPLREHVEVKPVERDGVAYLLARSTQRKKKERAIRAALVQDGAYLLKSNYHGWPPEEFWETYMPLTVAEKAFRTLKSELLIRPMWHQYDGRVEAHVMVCVLAYALWKTLDHLAKQAGLTTEIHKPDSRRGRATAKARPMSPEVILRELAKIQIGDIVLDTSDGRQLALRRVARPMPEQSKILAALKLNLPERLSPDRLL